MHSQSLRFVTRYSPDGSSKDLPDLNFNRNRHACSGYYNQNHFVLLVVGGRTQIWDERHIKSESPVLTSTEVFEVESSSQWMTVEQYPLALMGLSAATIDNKIYVTGDVSLLLNNSLEIIINLVLSKSFRLSL